MICPIIYESFLLKIILFSYNTSKAQSPSLHFYRATPSTPYSQIHSPFFQLKKRASLQEIIARQEETGYNKARQEPSYSGWTRKPNRRKTPKSMKMTKRCTDPTVKSPQIPPIQQQQHIRRGPGAAPCRPLPLHSLGTHMCSTYLIQQAIFFWYPPVSLTSILFLPSLPWGFTIFKEKNLLKISPFIKSVCGSLYTLPSAAGGNLS